MVLNVQIKVGFMNIVKVTTIQSSPCYDGVQAEWSGWSDFISDSAWSLELCEDHQLQGADIVLTFSVLGFLLVEIINYFYCSTFFSRFLPLCIMYAVY